MELPRYAFVQWEGKKIRNVGLTGRLLRTGGLLVLCWLRQPWAFAAVIADRKLFPLLLSCS